MDPHALGTPSGVIYGLYQDYIGIICGLYQDYIKLLKSWLPFWFLPISCLLLFDSYPTLSSRSSHKLYIIAKEDMQSSLYSRYVPRIGYNVGLNMGYL